MTDIAKLGLYVDSTGVVRATDHLGKFGKEGQRAEGIAGKFGKTGKAAFGAIAVAAAGAVSAIASIGGAVSVIRQFETSMSQVSAITGATKGELEALRDVAKDLGSTTEFSAAQAADGLRFLGMAGLNAAESMKAIPAVLDLATAASMGLAEAADISSNVLSGFGLEAGAAAQVADVLAAASSRANTSVSQLGNAMSTVAPISSALGIDLADTAAAIGVLSDAGIQGERAGTALRGVLASLAGPTAQAQEALAQYGITAAQVNPETQSLTEIFGLLAERGLSTADAMTIFGREAASGALVLAEASTRVGEFGEELRDAEGAAADMAAIMRDNLGGAANTLMSTVQGLAIALGEAGLTAVLIGALKVATEFARGLTNVAVAVGDFFAKFQGKDQIQAAFEQATDNVTIALGDQIRQLGQLQQAMQNSGAISLTVAESRLSEAEAIREVIAAEKEQLVQKTLLDAGYGELLGRLEATRAAMRGVNAALSEGDGAAAMQVESYRQLEQTMVALLDEQQAMLESARETVTLSEEQEQALSDAETAASTLRTQIQNIKDGLVLVNGQWVDVVTLSDRAAARSEAASAAARGLAASLSGAAAQARVLVANLGFVPTALGSLAEKVASQVESMTIANASLRDQIDNGTSASIAAIKAERDVLLNRMELEGADMVAQSEAIKRFDDKIAVLEALTGTNESLTDALAETTSATTASGGAASAAAKEFDKFADEIERLNEAADPMRKFNRELDHLNRLNETGQLTEGAYAEAFRDMNAELVESTPLLAGLNDGFGQFIDYALDGFKDGMAGIWDIFKRTLASMIATAAKSRITFGLGMAATGGAGAAAAGQPGGGIMSSILPSVFGGSGLLAGVGAGASAALGLGGYTSAGIFSIGANAATAAAATGASALSATIGAALPVIGIGLALVGLFKKTEVLVAEGVRARIDGAMLELDSYEKTKKDNMFGMSSGFSRDFDRMDDEVQSAVQARLNATIASLQAFGLGTDLTGFSFSKRTEIKDGETFEGESEEVIREALSAAIEYATDGALNAFARSGEDMAGTLERLVTSLNSVNPILATLGDNILPLSLDGAAAASALADLAGGLEAFGSKAAFVFENFLTDQERLNVATQQLNDTFGAMSVALPETHAQFRALMDAQDLSTEAGRQLYTALLDVAPLFVEVKGTAQDAAGALEELAAQNTAVTSAMSDLRAAIAAEVSPLQDQLRVAQDAMRESESVANALRSALRNMRTESQRSRVRASAQDTLRGMLSAGRISDTEAFRDALSVVQEPSENLFGSFVEYQRDFYRTANLISSLETKADRQLSADQRTASGIETQISQLNALIGQYDTQISATMSVANAVRSLEDALTAQQEAATAASPASREDAYLAANPDVAAAVAAGMFSSGAEHFALHGQFEDRPAFANGGMHTGGVRLVGERGPELEVTGPSRIYSASQTKDMMHDDVLRKEVREMKEYIRELVKINHKQERTLKEIEIQGETT